jgi:hypothetical protein
LKSNSALIQDGCTVIVIKNPTPLTEAAALTLLGRTSKVELDSVDDVEVVSNDATDDAKQKAFPVGKPLKGVPPPRTINPFTLHQHLSPTVIDTRRSISGCDLIPSNGKYKPALALKGGKLKVNASYTQTKHARQARRRLKFFAQVSLIYIYFFRYFDCRLYSFPFTSSDHKSRSPLALFIPKN